MKRKKIISTFTTCALIASFALMSVASSSSSSETKKIVDDSDGSNKVTDSNDAKNDSDADKNNAPVTIDEQVLVDEKDLKITAKGMEEDLIWGTGVKLFIENNSKKDYAVTCDALIVNNYMISDLFSSEITAGMSANETMNLSSSQLAAAGIDKIGQIEIDFRVYDPDSYDTLFDPEIVTIKTSLFDQMDTTPDDAGKELYNNKGIRIVGKYVDEDSFWGAGILLYIENNTKKNITVQCDSIAVNGLMVDGLLSASVYPGKMAIDDITLFSSDLEENGIESIDEVSLSFNIFDTDSYDTIDNTKQITFSTK